MWSIKSEIEIKNQKCMNLFQPVYFSFSSTRLYSKSNSFELIFLPLCSVNTWSAGSNHEEESPPDRHLCPPACSQLGHFEATAVPLTDPGRRRCTAEAGGLHGRPAVSGWEWAGRGATPEVHLEYEKRVIMSQRKSWGRKVIFVILERGSVLRWMQNDMHELKSLVI